MQNKPVRGILYEQKGPRGRNCVLIILGSSLK
jgi:hypothetical protein